VSSDPASAVDVGEPTDHDFLTAAKRYVAAERALAVAQNEPPGTSMPAMAVAWVADRAAGAASAREWAAVPPPVPGAGMLPGLETLTPEEQAAILRRLRRMAKDDLDEDRLLGRDGASPSA
jgi:hypothetical protein